MTNSEMVEILGAFASCFPNFEVSDAKVNAWLMGCGHQSPEAMKQAACAYVRTSKWPPTPADINQIILDLCEEHSERITEGEAFAILMGTVAQFGSYQQDKAFEWLNKNNPRVAQCAAIMDWKTICAWKIDDEPANRAHFWKVYLGLRGRDKQADLMGVPRPAPLMQIEGPTSIKNILSGMNIKGISQ